MRSMWGMEMCVRNRLRFQVYSCRTRVGARCWSWHEMGVWWWTSMRGVSVWDGVGSDGQTHSACQCGTMCSCSWSCGMAVLVMA